MSLLHFVAEIVRDLLVFVGVMFALLIVLLVVVSRMPHDNPLRQILNALSLRVAESLGAGLVEFPSSRFPASMSSTMSACRWH